MGEGTHKLKFYSLSAFCCCIFFYFGTGFVSCVLQCRCNVTLTLAAAAAAVIVGRFSGSIRWRVYLHACG